MIHWYKRIIPSLKKYEYSISSSLADTLPPFSFWVQTLPFHWYVVILIKTCDVKRLITSGKQLLKTVLHQNMNSSCQLKLKKKTECEIKLWIKFTDRKDKLEVSTRHSLGCKPCPSYLDYLGYLQEVIITRKQIIKRRSTKIGTPTNITQRFIELPTPIFCATKKYTISLWKIKPKEHRKYIWLRIKEKESKFQDAVAKKYIT